MLFSFFRYLNFCPDFFGQVGKQLDKKAKVFFNIYLIGKQIITTRIAQYLKN